MESLFSSMPFLSVTSAVVPTTKPSSTVLAADSVMPVAVPQRRAVFIPTCQLVLSVVMVMASMVRAWP